MVYDTVLMHITFFSIQQDQTAMIEMLISTSQPERPPSRRNMVKFISQSEVPAVLTIIISPVMLRV